MDPLARNVAMHRQYGPGSVANTRRARRRPIDDSPYPYEEDCSNLKVIGLPLFSYSDYFDSRRDYISEEPETPPDHVIFTDIQYPQISSTQQDTTVVVSNEIPQPQLSTTEPQAVTTEFAPNNSEATAIIQEDPALFCVTDANITTSATTNATYSTQQGTTTTKTYRRTNGEKPLTVTRNSCTQTTPRTNCTTTTSDQQQTSNEEGGTHSVLKRHNQATDTDSYKYVKPQQVVALESWLLSLECFRTKRGAPKYWETLRV
ncbi:hypothetical protein Pelo_10654 [Pelomyxa schiedti]|nr:hypothetical protein Pelo_10654 [Pelomyxa schiedti]